MKRQQTQVEKKKKQKVIMICLLIILIVAIILLLSKCCCDGINTPDSTPVYLNDDGSSLDGKAQEKNKDEMLTELENQQVMVTDKLSSNIIFQSGEIGSIGEWVVENSAENLVVLQAEIYLDDVLIAKTTPIYPNQHIKNIKLLETIVNGEYEVMAHINYYDLTTKEYISKVIYTIHLSIKE